MAVALLVSCGGSTSAVNVPAGMPQAVTADAIDGPCVYLLSQSQESDLSDSRIIAPNCYIYINLSANMSNSSIAAAKILYSGPPPNESGATFPEATPAPGPTVSDPCPTIPGCSYLANHPPFPPTTRPCTQTLINPNSGPIPQGCYASMQLRSNARYTMKGLYVINGPFHVVGANIVGSGVTIYMTSAVADTNFSNARLTLSAPMRGPYNGVLFYRDPSQSSAIDTSTCLCDFTGILYFPTAKVNYGYGGGNYQLLIFGQANISNSQRLRFGPP